MNKDANDIMWTVKEYFEIFETKQNSDGVTVELKDLPDWSIEKHKNGYCLCSPNTCASELGYRDESGEDIEVLVNEIVKAWDCNKTWSVSDGLSPKEDDDA